MTPAESPRRVHLLTALLLVGTFAAGVVTGAGVLRWLAPSPDSPRPDGPAKVAPPLPAARLPRELRLTAEQEASAREIGERYRPELEALAREMRPRVRAVQDRMEAEFTALLTPEQRRQLAEIEARRRNPPRPGEGPRPGGPPPPDGQAAPVEGPRGSVPADLRPPASTGARPPAGAPPQPAARSGQRPPPQEAIDSCLHLDLDQLCRFTREGREHEGSCRRAPDGQGPLHCAPDRHMEPPPAEDRPR
jgi:hypothetical protein